jgi:cytochrome d ubiquinol oxidase subunit II
MTLESTWFFLWGLLWAVYFLTDGFDLGIGTLMPFIGKTEKDKRVMVNSIGPLWDGNEVWLLTAGGVTFAAFPQVYAVMFSSLYSALMLILFALILRGVAFEFRSKIDSDSWRKVWDICIFAGSAVPALLFGVAFANIFRGIPIDQNGIYQGSLFTLLNPYGLLGGVLFLIVFLLHGSLWLTTKARGELQQRAVSTANRLWPVLLAVAVIFLAASIFATSLYANYLNNPILFVVILITVGALVGIKLFLAKQAYFKAWCASALTIVGTTFYGIIGLYPRMLPSNIDAAYSLTAHSSASSPQTLKIMLMVVIFFLPVVLAYQVWAYFLFKGEVTEKDMVY